MSNKLLSIIIVTFNDGVNFEKTIVSILKQKIINREIVVIDGKSDNEHQKFIQKYKKNIDYLISEKDQGIYDAMNKGIENSKGQLLLFMNCGDYFEGQVLSDKINNESLLPVLYTNSLGKKKFKTKGKFFLGTPYCHQGIIFNKTNLRYNLEYKICSDYDFILRYFNNNQKKFNSCNFIKTNGCIIYDNSGFSSINALERDKEALKIVYQNYHFFFYILFKLKIILRNYLSKIYGSNI